MTLEQPRGAPLAGHFLSIESIAYASPAMALVVAAIALGVWRLGLRRSQSTGS